MLIQSLISSLDSCSVVQLLMNRNISSRKEVTQKRLLSMLLSAQRCMLGRKVICVRCINCPYINIAKGIRLHDKTAIFYLGKSSYK